MKSFQDLKNEHFPYCDWRDFLKYTNPDGSKPSRQDEEALDHYFQHFVYSPEGLCIKCQQPQGNASMSDIILNRGRFRWGLRPGEGQCSTGGCGYPARAIHRDIGPIKELLLILQFHPDVITWDK